MSAKAEDDLDDDLYGDLDANDLDANQLEAELLTVPNEPEDEPVPQREQTFNQQPPAGPSGHQGPAFNANEASRAAANSGPGQQVDGQQRIGDSNTPDAGKMFIGGLNWETTDEGLREYFGQFGKVDSSMIMRDPTGRSRGFAFLTFVDAASVTAVVSREHFLDGKNIDPKRAIPRAEHERSAKVFVGGLAPSVTQETLKTFFSQFGGVLDATVMYDRESTRSKGFGFVNFADESSVDKAMLVHGLAIDGKQVEVKRAQPRGAGPPPVNGRFGGGQRSFGQQASFGGMPAMGNMAGGMPGMGGGGAFDPQAMAAMYQKMMMGGGMGMMGMGNLPAVNPAMMNGGMMGMPGMGMGMMNPMMGMMQNPQMGGMQGMQMQGGGMNNYAGGQGGQGGQGYQARSPVGGSNGQAPVNAPRGPAAMRSGPAGASPNGAGSSASNGGGAGPARYSTQGNARAKPY